MELEDVQQETALVIAELVKNKRFKGLMTGGCKGDVIANNDNRITLTQAKTAIEWRLNRHLHNHQETNGKFIVVPLESTPPNATDEDSAYPSAIDVLLTKEYHQDKSDYLSNPYDLMKSTLQFSHLKKILKPREYAIFERRFKNQETLDEIGIALHLTRERVRQIIHKVLEDLKLRLNYKKHKPSQET